MIKKDYIKELSLEGTLQKGSKGHDVEKVQEWLNLNNFFLEGKFECVCAVDGDFGPQTEKAVKQFQAFFEKPQSGVVDEWTWNRLTLAMWQAFSENYNASRTKREQIVATAEQHLKAMPRELKSNEGPWVRAYMGGHDGNPWAWCVGSALTILDQALSYYDIKFTDYYPNTYSCDKMGQHAKKQNTLIRNKDLREMSLTDLYQKVKPGDIIQVVKTPTDWTHCAIILQVHDDHFVTAEGNTNDEGSREGFEFVKRKRYFHKSNLDVLTLKLEDNE